MNLIQLDSGLLVPVEKTLPQPEPDEPPRGEYGEPWEDNICCHESEAWDDVGPKRHYSISVKKKTFDGNPYKLLKRLYLCLNACRGLSDETLESVNRGDLVLRPE